MFETINLFPIIWTLQNVCMYQRITYHPINRIFEVKINIKTMKEKMENRQTNWTVDSENKYK